jgi:hypothetical protein
LICRGVAPCELVRKADDGPRAEKTRTGDMPPRPQAEPGRSVPEIPANDVPEKTSPVQGEN